MNIDDYGDFGMNNYMVMVIMIMITVISIIVTKVLLIYTENYK